MTWRPAMEIFSALSHPLRERILKILDSERLLAYKDLMDRLGMQETGLLNYHLKKLEGFIEKQEGLYRLTSEGRNAIRLMLAKEQLMTGEAVELHPPNGRAAIHRIGVILCSCGPEIGQTIDINDLVERTNSLPHVVATRVFPFLCMLDNVDKIREWCEKQFLNGLVIAACSPRLHHEMFTMIGEKLDVSVEFANIREHCSWVHRRDPARATEKGLLLIRAAVAMLHQRVPVPRKVLPIRKSIAIIGGGLAGMTAASVLSRSNYQVILLERNTCLGGVARLWERVHGSMDCSSCMIGEQVASTMLAGNVRIHMNTELKDISGITGNYEITAEQKPRFVDLTRCTICGICAEVCPQSKPNEFEFNLGRHTWAHLPCPFAFPNKPVIDSDDIEACRECRKCEKACPSNAIDLSKESSTLKFTVGALILATGAALTKPESADSVLPIRYDPGMDVITSYEFERMLAVDGPTNGQILRVSDGKPAKSVVLLQCVNATQSCSSYCCSVATKYLDLVSARDQDIKINVLYDQSRIPSNRDTNLPEDSRIYFCEEISVRRHGRSRKIETDLGTFPADLVVLNMGMNPGEELAILRTKIQFALNSQGYIDPLSLPSGMWACGSATGPKVYPQLVAEARSAALEALLLLGNDSLEAGDATVQIDQKKCGLCNLCVEACQQNAISLSGDNMRVDAFKCSGCGACAAICPTGAISAASRQDEIHAAIAALSHGKTSPRILVFCCESCGYPAIDSAGVQRLQYDPGVVVLSVPCAGCVDASFVTTALKSGFDGVLVVGCHESACRYLDGINKAERRLNALGNFFGEEFKQRVHVLNVSAIEGYLFADEVNQFALKLGRISSR